MPHDPARIAETRAWLLKAAEDLRAAEVDLAANPPLVADAAFHAQQTGEKTLKAFLTWHGQPLRKTHNLVELGQACMSIDPALENLLRRAAPLTEYAWRFRYPGDLETPPLAEVLTALQVARDLFRAVNSRLPAEAQG